MKLSCDSLDLSDALTQVGKALPLKKVMPILNGIKLKAEGDTLTLTATDLELSIEKKIKADIFTEGETVILGKYFTEYVRKIDKEDVIIDTSGENTLKLTYGENNGYIQTMEADEYPAFKNVNDENSFYIVKKELKNLIEKIIFCTDTKMNTFFFRKEMGSQSPCQYKQECNVDTEHCRTLVQLIPDNFHGAQHGQCRPNRNEHRTMINQREGRGRMAGLLNYGCHHHRDDEQNR